MQEKNCVIGIDLGTTYSCVGVFRNNKVEIIQNDVGLNTMPSYVSFTDTEIMVGDSAKSLQIKNVDNTIYDVKRLMGQSYNSQGVQKELKQLLYKVTEGAQGQPQINVQYKGEQRIYQPEQISAFILQKLKRIAEQYLGHEVTKAVITVPAYFNDQQRKATKDAGQIANLDVLRIINEPTAAALAYGLNTKKNNEQNVLVFDLGGGTFDTSLLTIEDGIFEVRATNGDTHLGGEDFDNILVDYCVSDFKKKTGIDLQDNSKAKSKLKQQCEKAKRILSQAQDSTIECEALANGLDYTAKLTRAKFEELCLNLFKKCLLPVEQVLQDAQISKNQVNEVILVGGSTRILKIQQLLREFFNNKQLNQSINPDEAVAYGAAIQGAILVGNNTLTNDLLLLDVTPISLGIETAGGIMTVIVPKNSTIPIQKSEIFTTYTDNQSSVNIVIYEGERKFTKDNNKLGVFLLDGIPPAPSGKPQIEVTYDIDTNGILSVKAVEKQSGKQQSVTISNDSGRLTALDIQKMTHEAELYRQEDEEQLKKIILQNDIQSINNNLQSKCQSSDALSYLSSDDLEFAKNFDQQLQQWNLDHPNPTLQQLTEKKQDLMVQLGPLLQKIQSGLTKQPEYTNSMDNIQNLMKNFGVGENNQMPNFSQEKIEEMLKKMKNLNLQNPDFSQSTTAQSTPQQSDINELD